MENRASTQQPLDDIPEVDSTPDFDPGSQHPTPPPPPSVHVTGQGPTPVMRCVNAKILVADDSAVVAAMLTNMLQGEGYQIVRAADGIEATQRAYSEMPDLILLDIFMPRMNGYQACRLLKNDPAVAGIPVIILTGSDSTSAEFWSLQTGANAFMTKGFEPRD